MRVKKGKLSVTLRRGLDANGVLNLLKMQQVSSIRTLKVPGSVGLTGLRALVSHKRLGSLHSISINGFGDTDDAIDMVFESKYMARLRVLKVWNVSDAIDMRLTRGDFVDALRQVEIRSSPELTSLDRYFESKRIGALRFLTLHRTALSDASVLLENPEASQLRALSLTRCDITADTVEALIKSPHAKNLKKLNLSYNREDNVTGAIYRLLRSRALPALESLTLCGCELEGFDWQRVDFPALKHLDVRDNALDLDEIKEMLQAPGLPKLTELVVSSPEAPVPSRLDKRIHIDDHRPAWR